MKMFYWIITVIALSIAAMLLYMCGTTLFGKNGYSQQQIDPLVIVAHRGGAGVAPENSLAAIGETVERGVDMIEIDIQLTKDGEIVVCHDSRIERTTNGKGVIADMTLEQLREYSLLDKNGNVTSEKIPTLGEVFELVDGRCKLLIDVKRTKDAERMAKALINEVALYQVAQWVVVQSFDDAVLEHLHRLGHPFPLEKLFVFKVPFLPIAYDGKFVGYGYTKYDYISSFNFYFRMLPVALVEEIKAKGKKVKIWTLDAPEKAPCLPVDGVITDRPALWKKKE